MNNKRIEEIKEKITDLLKRWPAHTPSPALIQQLDDLEDELARETKKNQLGEEFQINLTPIGYVANKFSTGTDPEKIRKSESTITLSPHLKDGLYGLEPGQQVMVIFFFHKSQDYKLHQPPHGDPSLPPRGVFALRSPHRPNPIGVTVVDLLAVEGNTLRVRGLDALNGTPVLDIKPANGSY